MTRLAPDPLAMRAARRPGEPALRTSEVAWTRAQLLEAADGLACALAAEGVGPGVRVASLLADDAPAVVLLHAVRRLGAVLVPLNRRATAAELQGQCLSAETGLLVADGSHAARAVDVAGRGPRPLAIEALLAGAPCGPGAALREEVDLDAPALIVFTSGTSGRPKGALLTHGNLAASAHAWANVLEPHHCDRWLACLPLFHVAGLAIVARATRWGALLQVTDRFDPAEVASALDEGISHLSLVPVQLVELLAARAGRPVPPTLRAILLGGGPIPADVLGRARAAGYPVLTTYGLTETGSGIAVGGADEATLRDPATTRALPGVELRVDPDDALEGGEVLVRAGSVFSAYVGDPGATAAALRDGWLHTGDFGTLDADGLLRIVQRRDDLIVSGGENVYPAEVEAVLLSHPAVSEAAVVGVADERWGSVPVAAVVRVPGSSVGYDDLRHHCRQRLAGFKVPVSVTWLEGLPLDALGKVRRSAVRDALGRERR